MRKELNGPNQDMIRLGWLGVGSYPAQLGGAGGGGLQGRLGWGVFLRTALRTQSFPVDKLARGGRERDGSEIEPSGESCEAGPGAAQNSGASSSRCPPGLVLPAGLTLWLQIGSASGRESV